MIKFGSRTELYIAKHLEPQVVVRVGQAVNGAADVIATVKQAVHAAKASVVEQTA